MSAIHRQTVLLDFSIVLTARLSGELYDFVRGPEIDKAVSTRSRFQQNSS